MTDDMEPDQHQGGYGEPWVWLWPMGLRRVGKGKSKRGSRDHRPTEYTLWSVCIPIPIAMFGSLSPEVPLLRYAKTKVRLPALTPLAHIESPSCLTDLILARIPCEEKQVVAHLFERCDAIVDAPAAHEL